SVTATLIGMRAVLPAPFCFVPASTGSGTRASDMIEALVYARSRFEPGAQARGELGTGRVDRARDAEVGELRDGKPRVAAGIDAVEGAKIHRDVHGHPVIRAAVAHLEAERCDLGLASAFLDVDARRRDLAVGG